MKNEIRNIKELQARIGGLKESAARQEAEIKEHCSGLGDHLRPANLLRKLVLSAAGPLPGLIYESFLRRKTGRNERDGLLQRLASLISRRSRDRK